MPNRNTFLKVFVVLVLAFLWGYKKDAIYSAWKSLGTVDSTPTAVLIADPTSGSGVAQNANPTTPSPFVPSVPIPGAQAPNSAVINPSKNTAGNLSNTLDSIRPGQIQQEQITQRNAYFDQLSKQLRELQGGTPAPTNPLPTANSAEQAPGGPGVVPQNLDAPSGPGAANSMPIPQSMPGAGLDQQTSPVEDDEAEDADLEDEEEELPEDEELEDVDPELVE